MNSDPHPLEQAKPQPGNSHACTADAGVCWNCGSAGFKSLFEARDFDTAEDSFPVRRCRQCGLCYTGGVSEAELAAIYSRSYYGSGNAKFLPVIEVLVRAGHRRQAKKILDVYRARQSQSMHTAKAVSVLDIGCGRALLLQAFDKLGAHCLGIERGEFPGSVAHKIEMHTGALHDRELCGRRFDIIILWHVLEHITQLGTLLEELPRHLNPDGLLVISVPNFESWQSRFFKQYWFHLDIPRHVAHFEKDWLDETLCSLGLEIVSRNTFTASQNIYGFLQSSLNRLFARKQNRLYQLLTRSSGRRDWAALVGWSLLAIPLVPFAVLEALITGISNSGATLTLYARYRGCDDEAASREFVHSRD
ncbi:MAG: class I SAM-dependent methyltransferase [Gammaproteobacteria bacterium]|nr:class I SAM-dependent methyltransferase [Gammaproteobacteria bacterium]